jgi:hypothetical protein
VAPVATQGKVPMIVMNAVTTGITAKSPYMLRTSMTMQQMTEPFGTWTAKNKIGKVYSLVSDYSTGIDAEARFTKGFTEGGGKIVGSARVPLANPDYSPFVQRIKDEKPDAVFFFAPGVEDGIGVLKAYSDKGLDKAGIKFLGVGDIHHHHRANAIAAGTLKVAGKPVAAHCQVLGRCSPRQPGRWQELCDRLRDAPALNWNGRFFYQANGGIDGSVVHGHRPGRRRRPLDNALNHGLCRDQLRRRPRGRRRPSSASTRRRAWTTATRRSASSRRWPRA